MMFVYLYAGYVLIATFYPFEIADDLLYSAGQNLAGFFNLPGPKDFVVNVFLFIPLGFLIYGRLSLGRGKLPAILLGSLTGAIFSALIEVLQTFFSRNPSAFDVLSNALGTCCGALIAALWPRRTTVDISRLWPRRGGLAVAICAASASAAIPFVLSIVQLLSPFQIWDSRFTFQIANEATLDRPWLGKIHFVALYSRALSEDEVATNFSQGFGSRVLQGRVREGLIALYTFSQGDGGGIVRDVSRLEPSLDLIISHQDHVRWLRDSEGIEILRPVSLRSPGSPTKIFNALTETQELSIEAWLTPRNTTQTGPARIVSFSRDKWTRNFTLAQQKENIHFRLRTPVTGINGTPLVLKTTGELSTSASHIVVTYKNGVERFYIDGKQQADILDLTKEGIIGFGTPKTPITQIAYSYLYFLPVSFLCSIFFGGRFNHAIIGLMLAVAVGTGLLVITEMFQVFAFDRVIDIALVAYGTMIATLGALSGRALVTKHVMPSNSNFRAESAHVASRAG